MPTEPTPATGPEAAAAVHYTDPRVNALARAAHAATGGDARPWSDLHWHEQHEWRTGARDWLRIAVALGLLPRVIPSTGQALAAVALDVRPGDGRPRTGSRGRAATLRTAAAAVSPAAFGGGGPDHFDAWTDAEERLLDLARQEDNGVGDARTADDLAAALARIEAWADQLDDAAGAAAELRPATDPVADVLRRLIQGEDRT